jgi:SAM-dependent methyltransferase
MTRSTGNSGARKSPVRSQAAEIFLNDLGLRDAAAAGGFNFHTGELRPGFAITAEDVVLDVGCGEGIESLFCARQGAHVIYADSDPDQVAIAGRRLAGAGARALTPVVSDTNPLPLPDGIASRVIAAEVIEHVDDPAQFLSELVRAGRPGALYLLAVPDPAAEELQRGLAAPAHFQKPNHIRVIGRDEFARMITDAGLVIQQRGAYGFYQSIWWMFFWICKVDLSGGHPLLDSWSQTWRALLDTPGSADVRRALNDVLPKSQYIVARKPGGIEGTIGADVTRADQTPGRLRRALQSIHRVFSLTSQPAAVPPSPTPPALPDDPIDSQIVGLHDAVESGWFKMDRKELFEGFPIIEDDIVLDVGCGGGNYSELCGKWGAHVIFTDIDPENVVATGQRLAATPARGFTPIVGDASPLPLEDESITKIISTEVIEHVDDPAHFLNELVRVGKPGALYLLAVPDPVQENLQRRLAPPSFFVKPEPGEGTIRGLSSGHLRTIGREEFERMIVDAGLIVEQHRYAGFYWALWFAFFWICDVDFSKPYHPLLAHWARTWKIMLDMPDAHRAKDPLDGFMPKSQIIIARKPPARAR